MDECINKMYKYNGILLGPKKEILPFATIWTDLGGITQSEVSQKRQTYDFTYV